MADSIISSVLLVFSSVVSSPQAHRNCRRRPPPHYLRLHFNRHPRSILLHLPLHRPQNHLLHLRPRLLPRPLLHFHRSSLPSPVPSFAPHSFPVPPFFAFSILPLQHAPL